MVRTEAFDQVEISSRADLRAWLEANHERETSVWLVTFKKHVEARYVSREDVLDELLCFGWIDGIRRKLDADRTMQLVGPRRAQHWARSYKERADRLQKEGLMAPAGLAAIEASKASGLWSFMDDVDALIEPPDLQEALTRHAGARTGFDAFPASARRFALRWIKLAKTPKTRARRVEETARRAARGEKVPGA